MFLWVSGSPELVCPKLGDVKLQSAPNYKCGRSDCRRADDLQQELAKAMKKWGYFIRTSELQVYDVFCVIIFEHVLQYVGNNIKKIG